MQEGFSGRIAEFFINSKLTILLMIALMIIGGKWNPLLLVMNLLIHMLVDDMKANKKKINLIQDQITHMFQIAFTWGCLIGKL